MLFRSQRLFSEATPTPRHVNMNTVVDEKLYEFLDYETEDQYILRAQRNHALHRIV